MTVILRRRGNMVCFLRFEIDMNRNMIFDNIFNYKSHSQSYIYIEIWLLQQFNPHGNPRFLTHFIKVKLFDFNATLIQMSEWIWYWITKILIPSYSHKLLQPSKLSLTVLPNMRTACSNPTRPAKHSNPGN